MKEDLKRRKVFSNFHIESKEEGKYQESRQSCTIPDPTMGMTEQRPQQPSH